MTLKERVIAAAGEILVSVPDGLTDEALARQVAQKVGRQMPPGQGDRCPAPGATARCPGHGRAVAIT